MHFLNEHDCAAIGGGWSVDRSLAPDRVVVAVPDPMPGMPYPGPGREFS